MWLRAALLAAGPGSVVSHRSAAAIHGLTPTDLLEITVPPGRSARVDGVIVHRAPLRENEVEILRGLRVTKPARTLIDLAAVLDADALGLALDEALSRRLVSCSYLTRRLDGLGSQGRRGTVVLRHLIAERFDGKPLATSVFERQLFRFLLEHSLPRPVAQHEVRLPSGRHRYLDYAYPDVMLGLEANSFRHHAGKTAWSRDNARNAELVAEGWRILPVTEPDITEHAARTAAILRRALGVRS
jgi:very-short-patch-repair endonuclease